MSFFVSLKSGVTSLLSSITYTVSQFSQCPYHNEILLIVGTTVVTTTSVLYLKRCLSKKQD